MKVEVTQKEAMESFESSVFLNESGDKFIVPPLEYYHMPLALEIDKNFSVKGDEFLSDCKFREFPEYISGMNMNFEGYTTVLFGNFRSDKNGSVFSITDPQEAKQVLIREDALGGYDRLPADSPEAQSSLYYSNTDLEQYVRIYSPHDKYEDDELEYDEGVNFYVVNVGHVLNQPDRNVNQYLDIMSNRIAEENEKPHSLSKSEYEQYLEKRRASETEYPNLRNILSYESYYDDYDSRLAQTVVIDKDGNTKFPEEHDWDFNHDLYRNNWNEFLKDEAVVHFLHREDSLMYFYPEWMPSELTEAQKETIINLAEQYQKEYNTSLTDKNKNTITPEDTIRLCNEKRIEQEEEKAFNIFSNLEFNLQLMVEGIEKINGLKLNENDVFYKIAEKYNELAEQYGFETKFEIKMEKNPEIGNENRAAGNRNSDYPGDR